MNNLYVTSIFFIFGEMLKESGLQDLTTEETVEIFNKIRNFHEFDMNNDVTKHLEILRDKYPITKKFALEMMNEDWYQFFEYAINSPIPQIIASLVISGFITSPNYNTAHSYFKLTDAVKCELMEYVNSKHSKDMFSLSPNFLQTWPPKFQIMNDGKILI